MRVVSLSFALRATCVATAAIASKKIGAIVLEMDVVWMVVVLLVPFFVPTNVGTCGIGRRIPVGRQ